MTEQFEDLDRAQRAVRANMSPRYKRLEELEQWVAGTWYQARGLVSWWNDSVPLWERAPCIVYPAAEIAIQSYVDLMLGERRFPDITSNPGEDTSDEATGLGEEQSGTLDRFIAEYHKLARFRSHARSALAAAMGCGTATAIHGVRFGKPFADLIPAKWGTPKFDIHGAPTELEIRYPYLEEYKRPDGKWAVRAKLYRRVIDALTDTTFLPADADASGREPNWRKDPERTVAHGLGFCPIVWYPFMRGCVPVNVIDGKAIHATVTDEIRQHDIAISQRHRGALLSEGQIVEIGVEPGTNPTSSLGRVPLVGATERGGDSGADNPMRGGYFDGTTTQSARMRGPGYPWQYSDPNTKVAWLAYPVSSLEAQDKNAKDLRTKLMELLGVVLLDHESMQGIRQLSGKFVESIRERQIDRCDQYRDDMQEGFLMPSIQMQLRIALKTGAGLQVPGIEKVLPILSKFETPDVEPSSVAA
jgi:hypothetical protein